MSEYFSDEVASAKEILESWQGVIEFLQTSEGPGGEKFNQESEVPGTGCELWWFDERVISVGNLLLSLETVKVDAGAPIPEVFVNELSTAVSEFAESVKKIHEQVGIVSEGEVRALNPSNWVIHLKLNNQQINFASLLQNLKAALERCLVKYYGVASILKSGGFTAFAEAVREFSEKAESVRNSLKVIGNAKEKIEQTKEEVSSLLESVSEDKNSLEGVFTRCNELLAEIESAHSNATTALENIQSVNSDADALKVKVEQYQSAFDAFQSDLDGKNEAFEELSTKTDTLFSYLSDKDKAIEETIKSADEMLKGATNAGLATTFEDTLSTLDAKLASAQSAFHWAIGFLAVSALPLGAYLIMASLDFTPDKDAGVIFAFKPGNLSPGTTLALALLMVPTVWLTKFAAARHHQLFQLKEHYRYKYTLAMAVDGFKKQAPSHADEIAAETFFQLSFNPADKLTGKSVADHPSPLMNWIMNKLGLNDKGSAE